MRSNVSINYKPTTPLLSAKDIRICHFYLVRQSARESQLREEGELRIFAVTSREVLIISDDGDTCWYSLVDFLGDINEGKEQVIMELDGKTLDISVNVK